MGTRADWIDHLKADPDNTSRWRVLADWLDEVGDVRGELIRLCLKRSALPFGARGPVQRRIGAILATHLGRWLEGLEVPSDALLGGATAS